MFIYHERQLGGLCGVHCLNNLLQGPQFGPGDLAEIGMKLDQEERSLFSNDGAADGEHQPYNVDPSADGGNFSIQVLSIALKKFSLELTPAKHPSVKELMKDPPKAAPAFLCQYKDHWFAVREASGSWWNLNSTRERPGLVSPFYLAAWLAQLGAEGHSIFLVRGQTMPEPSKPREEKKAAEENFHELNDLLAWAKDPNDKPLQGGEASNVPFPQDAAWDDSWTPAVSSTASPGGFQAWDAFGYGSYFGGAAFGGSDAVVEGQRRLLEQSSRTTAGAASNRGSAPGNIRENAIETQRRLLEEAQRSAGGGNVGGAVAKAKSSQPPSGGSKVLDEQRRLLEEANRKAIAQQQAVPSQPVSNQQIKAAPSQPAASSKVLDEQRRLLEDANRRTAQRGGQPPRSFRPSLGNAPLGFEALTEMGFKEPQIRAAEALTRGSASIMTDMLLRLKGVPAEVEKSGEKLAEMLQGAVLGLDRADLTGEAVLQLVTILCLPEARLQAASAHFDPEVLTEFLLSALSKRGERWAPEMVAATSVVAELMAAISKPGRGHSGAVVRPRGDDPAPFGDADDSVASL